MVAQVYNQTYIFTQQKSCDIVKYIYFLVNLNLYICNILLYYIIHDNTINFVHQFQTQK